MLRIMRAGSVLATFAVGAGLVAGGATAAPAGPGPAGRTPAAAQATSTLVAVRAAHHPGYDRLVFEFAGPVPERHREWVDRVIADPSGRPVRVAGHAFLQLRFTPADAHTDAGRVTVRTRITFPWPNVTQTVINGDFEGVLLVAVGLQRRTDVLRFATLTSPSRVVLDVATPYTWRFRDVYYRDRDRWADRTRPYTFGVERPVILPRTARQAMGRLFAGPTRSELARGLRFVRSGATGFTDLRIADGIARVRLRGGCDSHGSTYTIANEIRPTLRQFASVTWVKIYSPGGTTERPTGHTDSIPRCLEP